MTDASEPLASDYASPEARKAHQTGYHALADPLGFLTRHKWTLVKSTLASFLIGLVFIIQSVVEYTATTSVMIDLTHVGISANSQFEGALSFETGVVDSQVLLLQSDRMASRVLDRLDLRHNASFVDPPQSWLTDLGSEFRAAVIQTLRVIGINLHSVNYATASPATQHALLLKKLEDSLRVARQAHTYVLSIEYTTFDAALARDIAAAYASVYLEDQLDDRRELSLRAATWIGGRTAEIKAKADEAASDAETFRAKNRLTSATGRLIHEQSLADSNSQLSTARNDLTSAQAKSALLQRIIDTKDVTGSSLDALSNPIISNLRAKYLDAYRTNLDISSRLGPQHKAAARARKEMDEYEMLVFQELTRLLTSYEGEVKIAADRVTAIEASIESSRKTNDVDATAMSTLSALDQEAETYRNVYGLYLQKTQDLAQQTSIPISDAQIIGETALPIFPSRPKMPLIVCASLILGLGFGCGLAALRDTRELGYRTSKQIRDELGFEFVSYLPLLPQSSLARSPDAFLALPAQSDPLMFSSPVRALDTSLDEPMSPFAEALRSVKFALDYRFGVAGPKVIGFVSVHPNEGKSTTAKNFASLIARRDPNILLIDCDLRNPKLTRSLTPNARCGLLDLIDGDETSIDDAVYRERRSYLAFLPAAAHDRAPATGDILASPAMAQLMQTLRARFSLIVVDLPPFGAVTDANAAAQFVDGYQLIVEWGRTSRASVIDALSFSPFIAASTVGITLTKVDTARLALFGGVQQYGYYQR